MIRRNIVKAIDKWLDDDRMIFLLGPRQVGKTTLLKQYQDDFEKKDRITFFYNMENPADLLHCADLNSFANFIAGLLPQQVEQGKIALFFDEIQAMPDSSHFLKFIYDEFKGKVKIFVTGSASLELQGVLQDSLVNRKIVFRLEPFSFLEFLEAKNFKSSANPHTDNALLKSLLEEYLIYGGLPSVVLENDPEMKIQLLEEYVASYVRQDVRHLINESNITGFNKLLILLCQNMGQLKNNDSLRQAIGVDNKTLLRYLDILERTFTFNYLEPYFTNKTKLIRKANKVYCFDLGVRNKILKTMNALFLRGDVGNLFENFIYLELRKHFDSIYFARTDQKNEIDFWVQKNDGAEIAIEAKAKELKAPKINRGFYAILDKLQPDRSYIINFNQNYVKDYDFKEPTKKKKSVKIEWVDFYSFIMKITK